MLRLQHLYLHPPTDTVETPPMANPPEPHGDQQPQQVFEPFAPEVCHILRYILQIDLDMLDPALALEQAGIYNGEDLCMFSDQEIKNFNVNGKKLKPIYLWKLKNVMQ